jgi:hypothetical protein
MKIDSVHVRQIESKVEAERAEVSALDSKLTEKGAPYSKWKLRQAMSRETLIKLSAFHSRSG